MHIWKSIELSALKWYCVLLCWYKKLLENEISFFALAYTRQTFIIAIWKDDTQNKIERCLTDAIQTYCSENRNALKIGATVRMNKIYYTRIRHRKSIYRIDSKKSNKKDFNINPLMISSFVRLTPYFTVIGMHSSSSGCMLNACVFVNLQNCNLKYVTKSLNPWSKFVLVIQLLSIVFLLSFFRFCSILECVC